LVLDETYAKVVGGLPGVTGTSTELPTGALVGRVRQHLDMNNRCVGEVLGIHHIKIAVSNLAASRQWYERLFELEPLTELRDDEDGVVRGVVYRSMGNLVLSLRENPSAARGMAGFDPFAIMLHGRAGIEHWAARLDDVGVAHAPIIDAPIGYIMSFDDPDGLELRFYTLNAEGADLEGRVRDTRP
jgi:catechol 2,3-dioxygenase-like lactoylglutathione lyase family enzyme